MKDLQRENVRLKRLVADLSLKATARSFREDLAQLQAPIGHRQPTLNDLVSGEIANSGNTIVRPHPRRSSLFVTPISVLDVCCTVPPSLREEEKPGAEVNPTQDSQAGRKSRS
jgi:hypothetical protein